MHHAHLVCCHIALLTRRETPLYWYSHFAKRANHSEPKSIFRETPPRAVRHSTMPDCAQIDHVGTCEERTGLYLNADVCLSRRCLSLWSKVFALSILTSTKSVCQLPFLHQHGNTHGYPTGRLSRPCRCRTSRSKGHRHRGIVPLHFWNCPRDPNADQTAMGETPRS